MDYSGGLLSMKMESENFVTCWNCNYWIVTNLDAAYMEGCNFSGDASHLCEGE
jgi:hypothetical protein